MATIFAVLCAAFLAARKRVLDIEGEKCYTLWEGIDGDGDGGAAALPFAESMDTWCEALEYVSGGNVKRVGNDNDPGSGKSPKHDQPREHSWPRESLLWAPELGWPLGLQPGVALDRIRALRLLLSQPACQRECARCADVGFVYGMELAQALAQASASSVPSTSEGGPSSDDD